MKQRWVTVQYPTLRALTFVAVGSLVIVAHPAMAQAGAPFETIMEGLADLLKNLALAGFVLGLVLWGVGQVTKPYFPQIAQMTGNNYILGAVIGIVVLYSAGEIAEWVGSIVGA